MFANIVSIPLLAIRQLVGPMALKENKKKISIVQSALLVPIY
jgi:hypothetical protein